MNNGKSAFYARLIREAEAEINTHRVKKEECLVEAQEHEEKEIDARRVLHFLMSGEADLPEQPKNGQERRRNPKVSDEEIIEKMRGYDQFTSADLAEQTGIAETTSATRLRKMLELGSVEKLGESKIRPGQGRSHIVWRIKD